MSALHFGPGGRTTLRVTHTVTPDELVWALAYWRLHKLGYGYVTEDSATPLTAAQIGRILRQLYTEQGRESWQTDGWADDLNDGDDDELLAWAYDQVHRHWPSVAARVSSHYRRG